MELHLAKKGGAGLNGNKQDVPKIPHITSNMIPLSGILFFYAQNAYQRLTTTIENLSTTVDIDTDAERKRAFLATIIDLRHDFIKLYTLVKWASNSQDVSKLIDLLNWLRQQEFFFDQLGIGLNELNGYSGAKLPNADIPTALEVLLEGRPQLPSYNLLHRAPVLPQRTLEVIKDLNICLTTRMVFEETLPPRFNSYEVKDGRIYFTVPGEFEVSVTVGNDMIIENAADYFKSPYYFIDFKFLFGVSSDGDTLIEDDSLSRSERASESFAHTLLSTQALRRLEHAANASLLSHGLDGLYKLLHRYSVSFKLYLLSRQLAHLCTISKWKGSIQYKYFNDRLILVMNYWSQQYMSRNWRSFIEVGLTRSNTLGIRWYRNGLYHDLDMELADRAGSSGGSVLSLDMILNLVANFHTESLIQQIYDQFIEVVGTESNSITLCTPHQLLISVAPKTQALFALNPLTGLFYFSEPSPLYSKCTNRVNAPPPTSKSKPFVSESETISHVVSSLLHLRLDTFSQQIHNRLVTTEWIHNTIIKLSEAETAKLYADVAEHDDTQKAPASNLHRFHFYRCKNWPSSWFLIILCKGTSFSSSWWVTRIKSVRGDWRVQWLNTLASNSSSQKLDYEFFSTLSTRCSNLIIDHIVHEELEQRSIQFVKDVDGHLSGIDVDDAPKIKIESSSETHVCHDSGQLYSLTMALYNDGPLLPVESASTAIFLKITLLHHHNSTNMKLLLTGELRGIELQTTGDDDLKITHRNGKTHFSITDSVDLSGAMNNNTSSSDSELLTRLFNSLTKLRLSIKLITILNTWNIEVVDHTAGEISVKVDDVFGVVRVKLPQSDDQATVLQAVPDLKSPNRNIESETQLVVKYINHYLSLRRQGSIVGTVQYLRCVAPVFRAVSAIKKSMVELDKSPDGRLPNNVRRLDFDVKLRDLNYIQFVFCIKYTGANAPKRIFKDKIVICLCLRVNKFAKQQLYLKMSLRDNANHKNLKHKKLFEMIFRAINEFEVNENLKRADLVKLNYEFLVDYNLADKLLTTVLECFPRYVVDMPEI